MHGKSFCRYIYNPVIISFIWDGRQKMAIRKCATDEYNQLLMIGIRSTLSAGRKLMHLPRDYVQRYAAEGSANRRRPDSGRGACSLEKMPNKNISDAQIQSQIDRLNIDYRRLNSDIGNVPSCWSHLAADTRIEFRLAVRDPNCKAKTGITRTQNQCWRVWLYRKSC